MGAVGADNEVMIAIRKIPRWHVLISPTFSAKQRQKLAARDVVCLDFHDVWDISLKLKTSLTPTY